MESLLADASFNMDLYIKVVQRVLLGEVANNPRLSKLDNLVNALKMRTGSTQAMNAIVPEPDMGIDMMMDAIMRVRAAAGGRRRVKDRTRKRKVRRNRIKSRARKN